MKRRGALDKREQEHKQKEKNFKVPGEIRFLVDHSEIISKCPICSGDVYKDPSNIVFDDVYFHFDCVVNLIKSKVELSENQNIYYYGSNNFTIVWERKGKIEVLKRIRVGDFLSEYVKKTV